MTATSSPMTVSGAAHSASTNGRRPLAWRLHQWAGLQLSLYLAFVFLTGTLAVLSYEIDWLLRPAMRVKPVAESQRISPPEAAAAVAEYDPAAQLWMLRMPLHAAAAYDIVVKRGDRLRHVYVHPETGVVTGEGSWMGVQRFLRDAHRRLMIMQTAGGIRIGIVAVCLSAVFLLVSLISSFWIYKRWWRGFLRWPRGKSLRSSIGDLHRWAGLWSLWFVVVMCWTGLWYLAEEFGARPPSVPRPTLAASLESPARLDALQQGLGALNERFPDYRITTIIWPSEGTPAFQVMGHSGRALLTEPVADAVWLDPHSGAIAGSLDPAEMSLHQRIAAANNPLHFGDFAGYLSKSIWFVFGVFLTGLAITGVMVYSLRIRRDKLFTLSSWSILQSQWQAMGRLRWLALGVTLLPFVLVWQDQ